MVHGTVHAASHFNAVSDASALRKAMKGLGTDEKTLIEVLCHRNNDQRQEIAREFIAKYGKDLCDNISSEISGNFKRTILGLLYKPVEYDVHCLKKAMKGIGTKESVLTEILTTRSNSQIHHLKEAYKKRTGKDLQDEVSGETSGYYKRMLLSCLQGMRDETSKVDEHLADSEAKALFEAGEGTLGTDESIFIRILTERTAEQLGLTFEIYNKKSGKTIFEAIESEMSGDLREAVKATAMAQMNRPAYFATRLHDAMKGLGTKDEALIRIIISRSEIDLKTIKEIYEEMYGRTLEHDIKGDTSGDYERALLAIVQ